MDYSFEQRKKAVKLRDEMFHDIGGGIFNGKTRDFVLKNRILNLWEGIGEAATAYFKNNNIEWHKDINNEPKEGPEGHLLSSNIACINHLFYLRKKSNLATLILKSIDNRIVQAEIVDDGYIEFEKLGGRNDNPLNEQSKKRTRGSKSTSIDALMVGKKDDGKNILVLIEWKYTETYTEKKLRYYSNYQSHKNYINLLHEENCPIKTPMDDMELFYEPYYQLMRQTLLGWKMVELNEYNCDEYIHLHIIPSGNVELRNNLTTPLNWKNILKEPQKYKIISPDDLLKPITNESDIKILVEYLRKRYW